MFSSIGQPKGFKDLYSFTNKLRDVCQKMVDRSKFSEEFGLSLKVLAQCETPEYAIFFEPIKEAYSALSLIYLAASQEQQRAVEDLNDIIIRFPVLQRKEQEKVKVISLYNNSNKKYKESKVKLKSFDTQENRVLFIAARAERAKIADEIIAKSEEGDSYQIRFDRFVQNRSAAAWRRIGRSMEILFKKESLIMAKLSFYCKQFRDNIESPEKILTKIENANKNLLDGRPDIATKGQRQIVSPNSPNNQQNSRIHQKNQQKSQQNQQSQTNAQNQHDQQSKQKKKKQKKSDDFDKIDFDQIDFSNDFMFDAEGIEYSMSDSSTGDGSSIGDANVPPSFDENLLLDDNFLDNIVK